MTTSLPGAAMGAITPDVTAALARDLGDLLPAFTEGRLLIVGGYLARLACGLPLGDDIDVLCDVDAYSRLRTRLWDAGFTISTDAPSTSSRHPGDAARYFRQKWVNHPNRLSIDCLVLVTDVSHAGAPDLVSAAMAFILSHDNFISRQLLGWFDGVPMWYRAAWVEHYIEVRQPGWVEGSAIDTSPARRAKWDALLPGLDEAR